jgi:hypothetical protein
MQESDKSRYAIDLYLLEKGYKAADIELAWEQLNTKTVASRRRIRLSKKQKIKRGTFLAIAILIFVLFYTASNPALLNPFPDYPSIELLNPNFDFNTWKYKCSMEQIKNYKVFITTDSLNTISDFYKNNAIEEKIAPNRFFSDKLDCFYNDGNPLSGEGAVNTIIVLDQSDPAEAAIIAKAVPKLTLDTKLLIVLQGTKHIYGDDP